MPRAFTTSSTSRHCAWVRSTPVGLWQQECSTAMSPAGSFFSAPSMPAKSSPWVFAS